MPERPVLSPGWVYVTLIPDGVGGDSLYINDTRVAGLKPLGVQSPRWEKVARVDYIVDSLPKETPMPDDVEAALETTSGLD